MKLSKEKEIEKLRSQDRALIREAAIEGGWYGKAKVQVHKNKKGYSRKSKYPSDLNYVN